MTNNLIETIYSPTKEVRAIIVRGDYDKDGITFVTPNDYSQQLAYMHHPKGYEIAPHIHNQVKREIYYTKEVLILREGKLRCDFYSDAKEYEQSAVILGGDVLLLVSGGHGFKCLEDTIMFEVKQGPYAGENDKVRFEAHQFDDGE